MRVVVLAAVLTLAISQGGFAQMAHTDVDSVRIITADVSNFWRAYDLLQSTSSRSDSVAAFQSAYLEPATPGLKVFTERRLKQADALLFGLGLLPRYYAGVRGQTMRIPEQEPGIRAALRDLQKLIPEARFPDIYFVIAGFISQGTILDGKMILAAEMVSADSLTPLQELPPFLRDVNLSTSVLPCILVHEIVHYQQHYPKDPSLLAQVLVEGVADFVTQQAIGCIPTAAATYTWGEAHEAQLWREFQTELDSADHSKWLYNGNIKDRPSQLGYWMGYQIAEAFYEQADNKAVALRELLQIKDYRDILERSGYAARFK